MAVLGSHEFSFHIWLKAQGSIQISTGRGDFAGGSAVLPTMSECLEIGLSDFEAENTTLKGNYLWQVVEIVIGGVPTILEVPFLYRFMSLSRNVLQGSISTNLFNPIKHCRDFQNVEVSILLIWNIDLLADRILLRVHFVSLLGRRTSFSICFLLYHSLLHEFSSHGIGFGLRLLAGSPN